MLAADHVYQCGKQLVNMKEDDQGGNARLSESRAYKKRFFNLVQYQIHLKIKENTSFFQNCTGYFKCMMGKIYGFILSITTPLIMRPSKL